VRLVAAQDEAVKLWIYERYGVLTGGRPCEAWGVVDGAGAIVGAFVLTHEHNRTMELHLYGRTSNDTWRAMFKAVFCWFNVYRLQIRRRSSGFSSRGFPGTSTGRARMHCAFT
jgi:hypothetical protein